jgi:glyoxylase-like metal-dependent hydrolase (beta-lactamase superfamily II)
VPEVMPRPVSPGASECSRRMFLAAGTATVVGAALPRRGVMAQSAGAGAGTHSFQVGAAEVTVITDGTMSMPLDWVLPGRDRNEIAAVMKSAGRELGELSIEVNATLIRLGTELVLVDTGAGPDFAPQRGKLAANLERAGIKPEAVTRVVFTHAHPDHLWGVIDPLDGGTAFPNARHLMCAAERDYWLKPGVETGVPEAVRGGAIGTQRRLRELGGRIETFQPGAEVAPGLTSLDTIGHSAGHVALVLSSGGERLVIGGDALIERTISFARPQWPWGPDWDTDKAIAARLRLLDMLAADKVPLLGYHLPWPGLGRVERLVGAAPSYRFVQG